MVTKNPNILITDENGSRVLEGEELDNFLAQQSKDIANEENWKTRVEADYEAKVLLKNETSKRLGLSEEEANLLFAPIAKPIHLL